MTDDELREIYRRAKTIVVIGASGDPAKPAHEIPAYLRSQGFRILPVSPKGGELFGEPVHSSAREIREPVDVVDGFRPPAEAEAVARDAIAVGARVLWFQPGTETADAARLGAEAGVTVVTGRCLGETHRQLGLGPGPRTSSE